MIKLVYIFAGIFIFSFLLTTTILAWEYSNTYPYPNAVRCWDSQKQYWYGCVVDPWNFYERECTSYAAHKINSSGVSMKNYMTGPNGVTGQFKNAGNWDDNARNIGFNVDNNPTRGSIAVWDPGTCVGCTVGHVAFVEVRNTNNTIFISEYNWNFGDGNYNERNNLVASSYIHFNNNSCGGVNAVLSNQNISGNYSCTASNSIKIMPESRISANYGNSYFKIQ